MGLGLGGGLGREGEGIENWVGRERVSRMRVWVGVGVRGRVG